MEAAGGERMRSWYLSQEEIERGSPSRRDGVGATKEAELRATYCSFIRDVGISLQLPQITIATAIVLCHRFYLRQSHAKNEWQTVATVCIFLASKIEDTPCSLQRVVIVAYETMYRKDRDAAHRIYQKEVLEKQKTLILVGETLLLSTIRFDFNIQHPYEPLKLAIKNLGISQKEVKQDAVNLVNDTLRTTLVIQYKPHYIAAGSLYLAAKFHNVRLVSEKGKVWWNEFDVAPTRLRAVIHQMTQLFMKRNTYSMGPAVKPTPTPSPTPTSTPVVKHQIISILDPALSHTHSPRGSLSNNFDGEVSRCMPVYSSAHHNSTGSSSRNEINKSLRMRMDHSLNSTAMNVRLEKHPSRAVLKADQAYHVCSGPKDINVTGVTNLIRQKRRIQEVGEHPTPIDKSDKGAWIGSQFRGVIVVETKPSSWKRQRF